MRPKTKFKKKSWKKINFDKLNSTIQFWTKQVLEKPILKYISYFLKKNKLFKINCIQIEYGVPYEDTGYSIQDILDYLNQYEYIEIFRTGTEHGEILFTNKND